MLRVYLTGADLRRATQVRAGVLGLELREKHLDVGGWTLKLDASSPAASVVRSTDGLGIEVVDTGRTSDRRGMVLLSGPAEQIVEEWKADGNGKLTGVVTVSGTDDMSVLTEPASPEPATPAPPYMTASHDAIGPAPLTSVAWSLIDRNVGGQALPERQVPGLVLDVDPAAGPPVDYPARWDPLVDALRSIEARSGSRLSVRVAVQGPPDAREIRVSVAEAQARSVVFSPSFRNVDAYTATWQAPTVTDVWAGGKGELTARLVVQASAPRPARWPRRRAVFTDHTSIDDPAELEAKALETLTEGAAGQSLEFDALETPGLLYRIDYDLGDIVEVKLAGERFDAVVSSAVTKVDAAGVMSRRLVVGPTSPRDTTVRVLEAIAKLTRRVGRGERR